MMMMMINYLPDLRLERKYMPVTRSSPSYTVLATGLHQPRGVNLNKKVAKSVLPFPPLPFPSSSPLPTLPLDVGPILRLEGLGMPPQRVRAKPGRQTQCIFGFLTSLLWRFYDWKTTKNYGFYIRYFKVGGLSSSFLSPFLSSPSLVFFPSPPSLTLKAVI